jgi:hypothetical protein
MPSLSHQTASLAEVEQVVGRSEGNPVVVTSGPKFARSAILDRTVRKYVSGSRSFSLAVAFGISGQ